MPKVAKKASASPKEAVAAKVPKAKKAASVTKVVAVAADDEPEYPAPPCKFRANRSRMTLTISIALHHVGPEQINLRTSKTGIELDTLKARRKFKMNRVYPRGIECGACANTS